MVTTIEIKANKAIIYGEKDRDFLHKLDLELSYLVSGHEYSPAYKSFRWDGRKRLMSKSLEFPVGLVPRVVDFFKLFSKNVEIIDHNRYLPNEPIDISNNLKKLNMEPRPYQIESLKTALEKKRGIIKIATGGGKTLLAAMIVAEVGKKANVYVIGKSLLWQFHDVFSKVFPFEIGMIGDGICNICDINIISVWTAGQAFGMRVKNKSDDEDEAEKEVSESHYEQIRKMISIADVSILDECHAGASETIQKISQAIYSKYTFGMSASPWRDDGADILIEAIFGKFIVNISASKLIKEGYLVKPYIKFISVPKMKGLSGCSYKEVYRRYVVENEDRNNLIVEGAKSMLEEGFTVMVLFKEIKHGKILHDLFKSVGLDCPLLSGIDKQNRRKEVIDNVLSGKCKLFLSSTIFDIGIDLPPLNSLIISSSGYSQIRALQRIGRVIRICKNKDFVAVLEFIDNCKYLKDHSKKRIKIYQTEDGFEVETI